MSGARRLTELDAGVLLADLVTLLVGEEHVGRETALGGVGVCEVRIMAADRGTARDDSPFFFLPPVSLTAFLARVLFSLGMMKVAD